MPLDRDPDSRSARLASLTHDILQLCGLYGKVWMLVAVDHMCGFGGRSLFQGSILPTLIPRSVTRNPMILRDYQMIQVQAILRAILLML